MENKSRSIEIYALIILFIISGYSLWNAQRALKIIENTRQILSGAPQGLATTIASSSVRTVGTSTPVTLFATSTPCLSRVISTRGQAISLSFDWKLSSTSLSETIGHIQAASTTEYYDSGLYGCSVVTAVGLSVGAGQLTALASSSVTVSEGR